jgi:hypothetical protein
MAKRKLLTQKKGARRPTQKKPVDFPTRLLTLDYSHTRLFTLDCSR